MFIVGFVSEAIARGRGTEGEVMSELRERSLSFLSRERKLRERSLPLSLSFPVNARM